MLVSGFGSTVSAPDLSQKTQVVTAEASTVNMQGVSNSSLAEERTVGAVEPFSTVFAIDSSAVEAPAKVSLVKDISAGKNAGLDNLVKDFSSDKPLMAEISYCESRFRQYSSDGSVLRGIENKGDIGLFQINEGYHLERSKRLGYDIYTPEGNMAYARLIFNQLGPQPWSASSPCWKKSVAYTNYVAEHSNVLAMSK